MFKGKGDTTQLGGPIKIAKITGQVAQHGFIAFLSIMAYISISLGFINLFPIAQNGDFFNNWLSIVYFYPVGFLIWSLKKNKIIN